MASNSSELAGGLIRVLADTFALYFKTHVYHWNVTAPEFYSLHRMLNEQYDDLFEAVDTIAEQIRALGEFVPADYDTHTTITEAQDGLSWQGMVKDLVESHQAILDTITETCAAARSDDRQGVLNMLADRQDKHAKMLWMLQASLGK